MQDYFSWLGAGGLSAGLQVKDANLDLIIICICQTLWDENMHKRLLCKEQTTGNAGDARSYTKKKKQIRISATIWPRSGGNLADIWPRSGDGKKGHEARILVFLSFFNEKCVLLCLGSATGIEIVSIHSHGFIH